MSTVGERDALDDLIGSIKVLTASDGTIITPGSVRAAILAAGYRKVEVTGEMVDSAARKIADMDGRMWENLPEGIARDQYTLIASAALTAALGVAEGAEN